MQRLTEPPLVPSIDACLRSGGSVVIVNHEYEFVFVEVPRTGSTAISAELRQLYGSLAVGQKHATYSEGLGVDPRLGAYRIFAGRRNPLDAEVSLYFKLRNNHGSHYTNPQLYAQNGGWITDHMLERFEFVQRSEATFADYFVRFVDSVRSLRWRHDQRRATYLLPFEDLQVGFATMLELAGVEQVRPLPAANTTAGRGRDFASYYTPEIRPRAASVFGPLMHDLGYEFPSDWDIRRMPALSRIAYELDGIRGDERLPKPVRTATRRPIGALRRLAVRSGRQR